MILAFSLAFAITPFTAPRDCTSGLRGPRPPEQPDQLASKTHPILLHYDALANADNPQRAADVLAALEISWAHQVDVMGFNPPVLPDAELGPEYDVYLVEYALGTAFVANDGWEDAVEGDDLSSTSSYMVIDNRLPLAWIDSYVAHEFNHACQYATDFTELTSPIWEGTASAASGWTFGAAGLWDFDVDSFQEAADWPSLVGSGAYSWYGGGVGYNLEYGAAMWVMFLDEKYGVGDGTKGVELWANAANEGFGMEPDAVDAFAETAGSTVGDAMNHLGVVRFLTGDDWDERGLVDAEGWDGSRAVPAYVVPVDQLPFVDVDMAVQPMVTGQVFLDIPLGAATTTATATGEPWIDVSVTSASGLDAGIAVMWWDDAGQVGDESTWGSNPVVSLPSEGLTRVAIAVTNLGPPGWDGEDDAYQRADFLLSIEPYALGTKGTTTPSTNTTTPSTTPSTGTTTPSTDATGTVPAPKGGQVNGGGCGCQQLPSSTGNPLARRR